MNTRINGLRKLWHYLWVSLAALVGMLLLLLLVLSNLNFNQFKGEIETAVTEITGRQLEIEGDLQFNLSLHPFIKVEKVSLANAAWSEHPQMITLGLLQLQLDLLPLLKGVLVVDQMILKDVSLIAEKNIEGLANWMLEALQSDETEAIEQTTEVSSFELPLVPVFKDVQFKNIHVDYSDAVANIATRIELDELNASTKATHEPISFQANGTVNQQPFNFTGNTDFQTKDTASRGLILQLDANALGVTLAVSGQIEQPVAAKGVDIEISLDAPDLNKTFFSATGNSLDQLLANVPHPLPLQFSARLADSDHGFELNSIKLMLADSDLNGRLSFSNQADRPRVQADLHSRRLNINQLLPKQTKQAETKQGKSEEKTTTINLSDTTLPFDLLQTLDATINYNAKQISAGDLSPEEVTLKASLDNGLLKVEHLNLILNDAPIRSSLLINSRVKTPETSVNLDIDQLNLGVLAKQLKIRQVQKGRLQSSVKLKAKGNSIKTILLSLEGQSKIQLENVQLKQLINNKNHNIVISRFDLGFTSMNTPLEYAFTGKVDNETISLSGTLATPITFLNNNLVELNLSAAALGTKLAIDGNINKPLNAKNAVVDINFTMPKPRTTLNRLAQLLPDLETANDIPELPVMLQGQLNISPNSYSMNNLQLNVGSNDLTGQVTANTHGSKPEIKAKLVSKHLDFDSLLPPDNGQSKNSQSTQSEQNKDNTNRKLFSKDPLPSLDALNSLNATVLYKLKKLTVNDQSIENISLDLSLQNGQLQLKPLRMDIAKGTIETNMKLSGGEIPRLQINIGIDLLDYDRLMAMLDTEEYAIGELNADIGLQAKGNSISALMAGLNGKVRVTTENGLLNSKALQFLSTDTVSLIPFTDKSDRQKLRCAVIQFNINDGIAETHAMVLDTGIVSALGTGNINLANESLALYVAPRSKSTSVMKLAMVPVNIEGSLASPTITPDIAGSTISTTKTATNIGLAVATGGISLLAEGMTDKLWKQFVDDTDYCALAMTGEKIVPVRIKLKKTEEDDSDAADYIEEFDDDDEF